MTYFVSSWDVKPQLSQSISASNVYTGWVKKSKLLILSNNVNKTEKIGGMHRPVKTENGPTSSKVK